MASPDEGLDAHAQNHRPRILRQHEACHPHARHSALRAQELLAEMEDFSPDETGMIADAIRAHSAKDRVDGSLAKLLKDADLLHHYLYNPSLKDNWEKNAARLKALLVELSIIDR